MVIGLACFAAGDSGELELMLGVLSLCMILPSVPYFLSGKDSIRSLKERFARRRTFGASEDLTL